MNYELCLKMREVKIQAQFIGTRLCWINHVWAPSHALATSELLHISPNGDFAALVGDPPEPFHPTEHVEGALRYEWLEGERRINEFAPTAQMEIDLDDKLPPGARIVGPVRIIPTDDEENGKVNFAIQPGVGFTVILTPRVGLRMQTDLQFAIPDQSEYEGLSIFPRVTVGAVVRLGGGR